MAAPVIRVEGLSKQYRLGGGRRSRTLGESLTGAVLAPFERMRGVRSGPEPHRTIWALDGVSFDIGEGEVLGVLGHNGAGKSTLLKIFSRITEPTSGRVEIHGRVGSLLEVGTGFHPEL